MNKNIQTQKEIRNSNNRPGYFLAWEVLETGYKGRSDTLSRMEALILLKKSTSNSICLGNKLIDIEETAYLELKSEEAGVRFLHS